MKDFYDTVIIGAGPAGLSCAYELASNPLRLNSITQEKHSVLIIDKGLDIRSRKCESIDGLCLNHKNCSVTHGFGGSGLFSDGKLHLNPFTGQKKEYSDKEANALMKIICDMFSLDGHKISISHINQQLYQQLRAEFNTQNIELACSPVTRIGLEDRIRKVEAIGQYLKSKDVDILLGCNVITISHVNATETYMIMTNKGVYRSRNVVIATGKVGVPWTEYVASTLGIASSNNPLYLGIRIEMPRSITEKLSELNPNPKLSMTFEDGTYVKTHCFSDKGIVVIADYNGTKLVDGNYIESHETNNSAVNIVLRINLENGINPFVFSQMFAQNMTAVNYGKPIVQTVGDFLGYEDSTSRKVIDDMNFEPTLWDCYEGDIKNALSVWHNKIAAFMIAINNILPGFTDENNLVYGPFLECWAKRYDSNHNFETKKKGLHIIGDVSGNSQGIIAAGMHGITCARGILSYRQ